jgi:DNA-binding GntR family transcriptional regulator
MAAAYDFDAYDAFNRQFHEQIYRATHNDFLAEQAISIRARLSAFRRTQLREGDRIIRSHAEHERVITAIGECDGDRAAHLMRAHMLNGATALGRYIADHETSISTSDDRKREKK